MRARLLAAGRRSRFSTAARVGVSLPGSAAAVPAAAVPAAAVPAAAVLSSTDPAAAAPFPAQTGPIGVERADALRKPRKPAAAAGDACGPLDADVEEEEMVTMVDPATGEWGGPTKGGAMPEPTRFGDWERKGRCTDF